MDNDCRVLVIIPAYNESENIEQVIGRALIIHKFCISSLYT